MIELIILAIALSMDAFAVSLGLGTKESTFNRSLALKAGLYFGFFQGFMPLIGYLAGVGLSSFITSIDHWVAFILLTLVGLKMIYESFGEPVEEEISQVTNKVLLLLAIATSIDAMAAGFTLTLMETTITISVLIIGFTTFIFSYIGVLIGSRGGAYLESKAELLGGIVLIAIGLKILVEHTLLN
ncbi:manganese efflux pump MntP [Sulfurimonas marina]|uniref:Putative manganese efflux pump MntP n=1 Tax=Sulfurimonas marina TaxID=2590551 RepID=A0A7M1AVL8_9BACT|nr:manganese efflux pump MntP family protein [Sulfurimonas marina]QOP41493.1 manganese efflux pump [Sulfurimonas marina]